MAGAASSSGTHFAARELRWQRSLPPAAATTAVFALCGARGDHRSAIILGNGRRQGVPAVTGGACGVVGLARALMAWVATGRRKVLRRSGSSAAGKERYYGQEEYAQNFDEGEAAVEPENLARSFSARYARRRLAR